MRGSSIRSVATLLAFMCTLVLATESATAQKSLRTTNGRASATKQNPILPGQRSDLEFKIHKAQFLKTPCPNDPNKKILTGLMAEVEIKWVTATGFMGAQSVQAESKGNEDGDDFFTIQWKGANRWTLQSMTRNGVGVFAGANPEGAQGGNGTWDGARVTPPSGFENGKPNPVTYVMIWSYTPQPGDQCEVYGLPIRGWYMHSYNDDYHFWADTAVGVSVGFPWSVSISGTVDGTSEHCWTKQLNDPTGKNHVVTFKPPGDCIPTNTWCPLPAVTPSPDPSGSIDPSGTNNNVNPGGNAKITVTGNNIEQAIITPRAPDGDRLQVDSQIITIGAPCDTGCMFEVFINVPADYSDDVVEVEIALFNAVGGLFLLDKTLNVIAPPQNPIVQILPPNPDGSVEPGSMIQVLIDDQSPDADLFTVSQRLQAMVVSTFVLPEQPTDGEDGMSLMLQQVGPGLFEAQIPINAANIFAGGMGNPMNGVIEANDGDRIHIGYEDNDQPTDMKSIDYRSSPDSIPYYADELPPVGGVYAVGMSTGAPNAWGVCEMELPFQLPPGADGTAYMNMIAQEIINNCPGTNVAVAFDGRLTGSGDFGAVGPLMSDPGYELRLAPGCPGDIADEFGNLGGDAMVSFGDFLALLGLIGPCPGGVFGCTGDIADDFGNLGGDALVSFGDFLALLGLIGACP